MHQSTIIAPSLLSCDFLNIANEMKALQQEPNLWIHLDIMDGHFVPNLTFGAPVIKNLHQFTHHPLDVHLMVKNPNDHIEWFKSAHIHNLTFHWEGNIHHDRIINHAKTIYPSVGISINPSTPVSVIPDYIFEQVNLVLVMSVNPGFGGQSFIPSAIDKIKQLKTIRDKSKNKFMIQVDGGINDTNAKTVTDSGANNLVAGNFIFKDGPQHYSNQIKKLRG
jgi:ribulose-phosphate 3-epimerase